MYRKLTIGLFLVSIVLITYSFFLITYEIPKIDDELEGTLVNITIYNQNYLLYTQYKLNVLDSYRDVYNLYMLDPNNVFLPGLREGQRQDTIMTLIYHDLAITGTPNNTKYSIWSNKSLEELDSEFLKFKKNETYVIEETGKYRNLLKERTATNFWATVIQIVGLILNQFAIILEFVKNTN